MRITPPVALLCLVLASAVPARASFESAAVAAEAKDWKKVRKLVEKGASPDSSESGYTLLMWAARQNDVEAVKFLLEKGATADLTKGGRSALYWASEPAVISLLLDKEPDPKRRAELAARTLKEEYSFSAKKLRALIDAGGLDAYTGDKTELLSKAYSDPRAFSDLYEALGRPALTKARATGLLFEAARTTETVKFLIAAGADPYWHAPNGKTAAMAAAWGSLEALALVYDDKSNPDAADEYGTTALMSAASSGNLESMKWLAAKGASLAAQGKYGGSVLMSAAGAKTSDVLKYLAAQGVPLDTISSYGHEDALIHAAYYGSVQNVQYLLDVKGKVFADRGSLETAYVKAAGRGYLEVLRLLKRAGADGKAAGAAIQAADQTDAEVVKFVLGNGADPNEASRWGTPLTHAAWNGSVEAVAAVLDAGGKADGSDHSALVNAATRGHDEVVRFLVEKSVFRGSRDRDLRDALLAGAGDFPTFRYLLGQLGGDSFLESQDLTKLLVAAAASPDGFPVVTYLVNHGADARSSLLDTGATPLIAAAGGGSEDTVKFLLARGADVKAVQRDGYDKEGATALSQAAGHDARVVKALLAAGAPVDTADKKGMTPLMRSRSLEATRMLLEAGANANASSQNGYTPLMNAAEYLSPEAVKLLLARGASVAPIDAYGKSALHYAAKKAPLESAELLLAAGAKVDAAGEYGVTPLMAALEEGRVPMAKLLVAKGADARLKDKDQSGAAHYAVKAFGPEVLEWTINALGDAFDANAADKNGETPLAFAQSLGVLRLLFDHGAQLSATKPHRLISNIGERPLPFVRALFEHGLTTRTEGYNRRTPLMEAALAGRDDLVAFLLERGADLDGDAALSFAAAGAKRSTMELLLSRGAAVNGQPRQVSPLADAAGSGDLAAIRLLLKKGADVNASGRSGDAPVVRAAKAKAWPAVKLLLASGASPQTLRENGAAMLEAAAEGGDADLIRFLVKNGAAVNSPEPFPNSTPLGSAIEHGKTEAVKALLSLGADPSQSLYIGCSALCVALNRGNLEAADLLVKSGMNLDALYGKGDDAVTDLMAATRSNSVEALKYLLAHGANVNIRDRKGRTALMHAAQRANAAGVALLLERRALANAEDNEGLTALAHLADGYGESKDILATYKALRNDSASTTTADKRGLTPTMHAINRGKLELIGPMIDSYRPAVDYSDSEGRTPLHHAVDALYFSTDGIKAVLDRKPNVDAADKYGLTPLLILSNRSYSMTAEGHEAAFRLLLGAGAKVNAQDKEGYTALIRVQDLKYSLPMTRLLLDAGASPDGSGPRAMPALYEALKRDKWNEAKLLLERRADLNLTGGDYNRTALSALVYDDKLEAVKFLLDHKANPNTLDKYGMTALDIATNYNRSAIASLLRERGARPHPEKSEAAQASKGPAPAAAAPGLNAGDLQNMVSAAVKGALDQNKPAPAPAAPVKKALVSDVDRPSYKSAERPNDFALVVGIENYSGDLPSAPFAERDAAAVRAHFGALGVPPRNLVYLGGDKAGRASLVKYLESWLPRVVKADSRVYFYFSGHGAPDPKTGAAYIVPWDGDPNFLEDTAYSVARLYEKLGALKAAEVVVALDSCFSGAKGRSVLPKGARPLVTRVPAPAAIPERLVSLAAADSNQITGTIDEQGHGTFTYYLLKGLNGAAQGSGGVTVDSLYAYLKPKVQDEAGRQNREQTPQALPAALDKRGSIRLR